VYVSTEIGFVFSSDKAVIARGARKDKAYFCVDQKVYQERVS